MWLQINGERREASDTLSLHELIESLNLAPERIAIELNNNVVRRVDWSATALKEGDRVEIVHFVGGGGGKETGGSRQEAVGRRQEAGGGMRT